MRGTSNARFGIIFILIALIFAGLVSWGAPLEQWYISVMKRGTGGSMKFGDWLVLYSLILVAVSLVMAIIVGVTEGWQREAKIKEGKYADTDAAAWKHGYHKGLKQVNADIQALQESNKKKRIAAFVEDNE